MNPPFLIEADHNSLLLGWQTMPGGIEYEVQMVVDVRAETDADADDAAVKEDTAIVQWTTLSSSLKGSEVRKKNVDHLHSYRFRMRAKFSSGWDLFSDPSGNIIPVAPERPLLHPPAVMGRDASSITLEW